MAKTKSNRKGPRVGGLRGLLDRVSGARLCFGEPVTVGARTVIPVARVRTAGGWGWGTGDETAQGGGTERRGRRRLRRGEADRLHRARRHRRELPPDPRSRPSGQHDQGRGRRRGDAGHGRRGGEAAARRPAPAAAEARAQEKRSPQSRRAVTTSVVVASPRRTASCTRTSPRGEAAWATGAAGGSCRRRSRRASTRPARAEDADRHGVGVAAQPVGDRQRAAGAAAEDRAARATKLLDHPARAAHARVRAHGKRPRARRSTTRRTSVVPSASLIATCAT